MCKPVISHMLPCEVRVKYVNTHLWNTSIYCCNLSGGVALIVWFITNGMCVKNNTIIYVPQASNSKRDCNAWSLLLLAAPVWIFAHMPLGISNRNKMVLWLGYGGRAEFSLTQRTCDRCGPLQKGGVLQPLRWRCVNCVIHHKWDVREE